MTSSACFSHSAGRRGQLEHVARPASYIVEQEETELTRRPDGAAQHAEFTVIQLQ